MFFVFNSSFKIRSSYLYGRHFNDQAISPVPPPCFLILMFKRFVYYSYVYVCMWLLKCMCTTHVNWPSLELQLNTAVSHHMSAGNRAWVLCKSSKSFLCSAISSAASLYFLHNVFPSGCQLSPVNLPACTNALAILHPMSERGMGEHFYCQCTEARASDKLCLGVFKVREKQSRPPQ